MKTVKLPRPGGEEIFVDAYRSGILYRANSFFTVDGIGLFLTLDGILGDFSIPAKDARIGTRKD